MFTLHLLLFGPMPEKDLQNLILTVAQLWPIVAFGVQQPEATVNMAKGIL